MAELATVRGEIKAWERSFRESNGKNPTVDDIRQTQAIASKYKLYKQLSRAAASSNITQATKADVPPSTPPRTSRLKDPTSVLLSKSRSIQPPAPLVGFNPFSPQKKKGKEKERDNFDKIHESHLNPFGRLDPSTRNDLLPPTNPSQASSSSSTITLNPLIAPGSAVSRARKRLRGEPVSPSPNKDKRRRVTSQTSLPFPRLNLGAPSSDEAEEDLEGDSSFVGDSPLKLPTSGKSYTQLFDEKPLSVDLFGAKVKPAAAKQEHENARNKNSKLSIINGLPKPAARRPGSSKHTLGDSAPNEVERINSKSKLPSRLNDKGPNSPVSSARSSVKRVLSDEEDATEAPKARSKSPLIPPSPPPPDSSSSFNRTGKTKSKPLDGGGRKKAKVDDARVDSGSEDAELHEPPTKLKIVKRNDMRRRQATMGRDEDEDAVLSDPDPVFGYTRFAAPHVSPRQSINADEGTVEIDLPDELRRVLALETAASKGKATEEKRILQGLLYGRRAHHYDPHKGGEIWDVGEDYNVDDENTANTEGEDDWEGEPVPWEAAEL